MATTDTEDLAEARELFKSMLRVPGVAERARKVVDAHGGFEAFMAAVSADERICDEALQQILGSAGGEVH